jgi:hypothetical protein
MAPLFHKAPPRTRPVLTPRERRAVFWSVLARIAIVAAILFVLLYGLAQLVARSNAFRTALESRLSALSGVPLRIDGRVRATEALNFKIRDIIGRDESSTAGLSVDTARVRWRAFPRRGESRISTIWLEGVRLTFSLDSDGAIHPDFLGALARRVGSLTGIRDAIPGLPEPGPIPVPTPTGATPAPAAPPAYGDAPNPLALIPLIRVQNASLHWRDASSNEIASATGIDFTWSTWSIPPVGMMPQLTAADVSRVSYLRAYADHVRVGETHVTGLRLELIQAGAVQYLVLLDAEDWGTLPPPLSPSASAQSLFREFFPDPTPSP